MPAFHLAPELYFVSSGYPVIELWSFWGSGVVEDARVI